MTIPSKTSLRLAIKETGGIVSDLAKHYNVSRPTIYRWLEQKNLRAELAGARINMHEIAKDVVYQRLMSDDNDKAFDAAKFALMHLNDDGGVLRLSDDILALIGELGLDIALLIPELELLIRAAADEQDIVLGELAE